MFGIDSGELLIIAIVTVLVVGPKELPRVLYRVGQFMNKVRNVTRHFRSGLDAMVREVELEEMQKKWLADNARIMKENPDVYNSASLVGADVEPSAETPPPLPETEDSPTIAYETPDYVVDVESLDEEHRPPKPEAAA